MWRRKLGRAHLLLEMTWSTCRKKHVVFGPTAGGRKRSTCLRPGSSLFVGQLGEDRQSFSDRAQALQEDAPELQPPERGEGCTETVQATAGCNGHLVAGRFRSDPTKETEREREMEGERQGEKDVKKGKRKPPAPYRAPSSGCIVELFGTKQSTTTANR